MDNGQTTTLALLQLWGAFKITMLRLSKISSPLMSVIGPTLVHTYSLSNIRLNYSGHHDANHSLFLPDQPLLGERLTNRSPLVIFFPGNLPPTPRVHLWSYSKCKGFHQWAIGSIIVLSHLAIHNDLTDNYWHENLNDYYIRSTNRKYFFDYQLTVLVSYQWSSVTHFKD